MTTEDDTPTADDQTEGQTVESEAGASGAPAENPDESMAATGVKAPVYSEMPESRPQRDGALERFYEVNIPVWAELGRVEMPIGELMRLDAGTVLRLERPVGEPVDIVSQGVTLAKGEVVVVDDCFAVRIKEIHESK